MKSHSASSVSIVIEPKPPSSDNTDSENASSVSEISSVENNKPALIAENEKKVEREEMESRSNAIDLLRKNINLLQKEFDS